MDRVSIQLLERENKCGERSGDLRIPSQRAREVDFKQPHNKGGKLGDGDDYTSENTSTSEYDDNGFILHEEWTRSDDKDGEKTSTTVDYDWEFDSSGAPTAYTVTYTVSGKSAQIVEYKVETDNFGNIVAVFDEHGDKVAEFEYERVDDPSAYSRSFPSKPVYYSVTG